MRCVCQTCRPKCQWDAPEGKRLCSNCKNDIHRGRSKEHCEGCKRLVDGDQLANTLTNVGDTGFQMLCTLCRAR